MLDRQLAAIGQRPQHDPRRTVEPGDLTSVGAQHGAAAGVRQVRQLLAGVEVPQPHATVSARDQRAIGGKAHRIGVAVDAQQLLARGRRGPGRVPGVTAHAAA